MSFSEKWEMQFSDATSAQISRWPWSDLVSFVMRYARPSGPEFRVLELGCGSGANVPFFRYLNVDYCAVEGSQSAVRMLKETYPDWADRFAQTDFTKDIHFDGPFDLIFDRGSLPHNHTAPIRDCLALVDKALKPGGTYIGIDWFSTELSDYQRGEQGDDVYTRINIEDGPLSNVGPVHFSDEAHILDLFSGYDVTVLVHKRLDHLRPAGNRREGLWNFVAVKPA